VRASVALLLSEPPKLVTLPGIRSTLPVGFPVAWSTPWAKTPSWSSAFEYHATTSCPLAPSSAIPGS
jgi:hypothetical protein